MASDMFDWEKILWFWDLLGWCEKRI